MFERRSIDCKRLITSNLMRKLTPRVTLRDKTAPFTTFSSQFLTFDLIIIKCYGDLSETLISWIEIQA